ncbi:transporter substrate-binding domain-containing protein [Demequina sp. B12]|uniref:transporter substrate-binding domain-containing protein n=1 Tax=Demequina sp. B12 TaxID=2992757 RepID=UPI00237A923C|nr:transporter substrate-binding domain-containing protein [Demequina sp. B12]MDE0572701.1 transporter substrate-binding domain-containing protein [Demequina sp. B12]
MKTRFALPAALVASALALTACSAADSDADPTAIGSAAAGTDTSLTDIQEAGVIVVGTEGTYRPFTFHADGTGELTGYDVEVSRAVAAVLGVEIQFEETQWDALLTGLEAGRFDAVANQVGVTPEREEVYEFSAPYTFSNGVVVVRDDYNEISSWDDIEGKTLAQSLTSAFGTLAKESGANIEAIEGWAQSVELLNQGRVDATINDKLTWLDYKLETGAEGLKVALETDEGSRSAFAFAGGDEALAQAVTDALATLEADGTLAELSQQFFGDDVSVESAS